MYRRMARKATPQSTFTFTKADLVELFDFESKGIKSRSFDDMKRSNGFAYGKWIRDISVPDMIKDIQQGYSCKFEYTSSAVERIHNEPILRCVVADTLFPFHNTRYTQLRQNIGTYKRMKAREMIEKH